MCEKYVCVARRNGQRRVNPRGGSACRAKKASKTSVAGFAPVGDIVLLKKNQPAKTPFEISSLLLNFYWFSLKFRIFPIDIH